MTFSVSFLHTDGSFHTSRHFSTLRAARKWSAWLAGMSYVARVSLWRGYVGEQLLEETGR